MNIDGPQGNIKYVVVVNHEEQFSIGPEDREIPMGWNQAGFLGAKDECFDHIEKVWVDMRPLSLRKHLEALKPS